jgi:hypothetical protein
MAYLRNLRLLVWGFVYAPGPMCGSLLAMAATRLMPILTLRATLICHHFI